ncbi:hypothetical protein SKAU_G00127310 [Synaphobranchus kaupii]|uniref:Uncharacterized protein n=1 Tax=Synaphobranchus kaupii TaxID=118154 RepID=A0A9Q1FQD7_SYNKA|nr:hypothetical protein SKAU_G00127310 [Synaphobranchus kaupii]
MTEAPPTVSESRVFRAGCQERRPQRCRSERRDSGMRNEVGGGPRGGDPPPPAGVRRLAHHLRPMAQMPLSVCGDLTWTPSPTCLSEPSPLPRLFPRGEGNGAAQPSRELCFSRSSGGLVASPAAAADGKERRQRRLPIQRSPLMRGAGLVAPVTSPRCSLFYYCPTLDCALSL